MSETAPKTLEALDTAVANIVEFSTDKGPKLIEWLYTQAPDVVEQLLTWHFVQSLFTCITCAFFIFAYPYIFYKVACNIYKKFEVSNMCYESLFWMPTLILATITGLTSQLSAWGAIDFTWLKIWLAPKVYLLEYVTRIAADKL